jgi:hypothetical protein
MLYFIVFIYRIFDKTSIFVLYLLNYFWKNSLVKTGLTQKNEFLSLVAQQSEEKNLPICLSYLIFTENDYLSFA